MIKAFEMVRLGEEDVKKKFPAMYNAFCYGAPPHAGCAPGIDRIVMLLTGEESIREVITFPMNQKAQDLMMGASLKSCTSRSSAKLRNDPRQSPTKWVCRGKEEGRSEAQFLR